MPNASSLQGIVCQMHKLACIYARDLFQNNMLLHIYYLIKCRLISKESNMYNVNDLRDKSSNDFFNS